MFSIFTEGLQTLNQLLSAGIAIMAFSLFLYALVFNLRDRVARSFLAILLCMIVVFTCDTIASVLQGGAVLEFLLRLQWVGIAFLPPSYLHFSDALLGTTGLASRGGWRWLIRLTYLVSLAFLATLPFGGLVGPLVTSGQPAAHLERTPLSWVFTAYYIVIMVLAWGNFMRANRRTLTHTGQRRMHYLLAGALAPALGSYPYLLFGSEIASQHPYIFWLLATLSNFFVAALFVIMAYAVAFFGVPWPDWVVRQRLFKWLLRGPLTAVTVLGMMTIVRRAGEAFGVVYTALVPIAAVASLLIMEYLATILSPIWERVLFQRTEHESMDLLQRLEARLLTSNDLRQFLEAVLAAACDRLQVSSAFVATLADEHLEMLIILPGNHLVGEDTTQTLLRAVTQNNHEEIFAWGKYWLVPLYSEVEEEQQITGLLGVARTDDKPLDDEQREALLRLSQRAALALEDHRLQQTIFRSLERLTPQVERFERIRVAGRYGGGGLLAEPEINLKDADITNWVKDALTHYWGGPKLTESPLLKLQVVQQSTDQHEGSLTNALRAVLRSAIDQIRPEGERRFTAEWILYNILEMKFMEGYKVRDIARRLAMSEADLYRKQRVAVEAVANSILEMERKARKEKKLG